MNRPDTERITRIREEGFRDADRVLLSAIEHKIIGSQPEDLRMDGNPRIPQAVLNGSMTISEVNALRQAQVWFADTSLVGELGELECLVRYIALIKLSELDSVTGELIGSPYLYGFYDGDRQAILTVDLHRLPIDPTKVNTLIAKKIAEFFKLKQEASS